MPVADKYKIARSLRLKGWKHLVHSAPSREETPATHRVEYIYNALYGDMTIDEIRAKFARIMAPYFRQKLEEDAKKKKRGSKK
jgi:hypothetical protein